MSDADVVARTLERARRRLTAATLLRWASSTLAAGIAGFVAATVVGELPFAPGRPLLFIGVTALALAGVMAAWRRPTPAQTAAALDARLGLADLAVAAHALRDSVQPMAQLVVREARLRLGSVSLSRVIPMPRRLVTWTSGAGLAALVLGVLASGGQSPAGDLVPAGGRGRIVSGGSAVQPTRPSAASTMVAEGGRSSAARPPAGPRESGTPPRSVERPSARAANGARASAARGQQAGARGGDGASDVSGRTTGRSGNAGRGAADAQTTPESGAGGVQQGIVTRAATAESAQRGELPSSTADIRESVRRAEAALARDEVPPRLKPVVRRYFQSMLSESGR